MNFYARKEAGCWRLDWHRPGWDIRPITEDYDTIEHLTARIQVLLNAYDAFFNQPPKETT